MRYRGLLLLILGLAIFGGAALAEVVCRTGEPDEQLGYSVAVSETTIASGANEIVKLFEDGGKITEFKRGKPGDQFGFAIALSGDTLVVGAPKTDTFGEDAGAVYIFHKNTDVWSEDVVQLPPGEGTAGSQFGFTVALSGKTLAVGAAMDGSGGTLSGAVYIFELGGDGKWHQQAKFPGAHPFDGLGSAISIDNEVLAAGAPFMDGPAGGNQGAVHLIRKGNSWMGSQPKILMASEAKAGDQFGYAVAIQGDMLAVGARRGDVRGMVDAGWVALFQSKGDTWSQKGLLTAGSAQAGDLFGNAVALSRGKLLVGAFLSKGRRGAAYLFPKVEDRAVGEIKEPPGDPGEGRFGFAVAMSGETKAIGAFLAYGGKGAMCEVVPDVKLRITEVVRMPEGDSDAQTTFRFTVTLDPPTPADGVKFDIATANDTATGTETTDVPQTADYVSQSLKGQIFTAGEPYYFDVKVKGDANYERHESFLVKVTNVIGATTPNPGKGTIENDDFPDLTINDVSMNEGDNDTKAFVFTARLSFPAGEDGASFKIATADGSAKAGEDYVEKSQTLKIPAGNLTAPFRVLVNGDTTPEPDETFVVNLSEAMHVNITNPQRQGTIRNDDEFPTLTIEDVTHAEGDSGDITHFLFKVSLSAPAPPGGVTFDIATADRTATEPRDYIAQRVIGQKIVEGDRTFTFDVVVNGDDGLENAETFAVDISNVTNAIIGRGQALGTISNEDAFPGLTIDDVSKDEGNSGNTTFTFTVSLSAQAPSGGVTFNIATDNDSASSPIDFTANTLTAQTIPEDDLDYTFEVQVNGDATAEPDETFVVDVTNVTNAVLEDGQGKGTIVNEDLTLIHDILLGGLPPPPGVSFIVEGVVTASFQGTDRLQGFFLQEEDADTDADPLTSEGIFVFCGDCPTPVVEGQRVRSKGPVSELSGMLQMKAEAEGSVVVAHAGNHLIEVTPSMVDLPLTGDVDAFYEPLAGMLVRFVDTLTVSGYSELARLGQIELFEGGRPRQFTETAPPDRVGYENHLNELARRRVILDDDDNLENSPLALPDGHQFIFHPRDKGGFSAGTQGDDFFRGGDQVDGLRGVLHRSFAGAPGTDAWLVRPTAAALVAFTVANPRPAAAPEVGGAIKAASVNLSNYFTTIDKTPGPRGLCGPEKNQECRGADSPEELDRQRKRAAIVLCELNADVFALMELENTPTGDTISDLLGAVNFRCGGENRYAFVNTGETLGSDAIRVALIYRSATLAPVEPPFFDLDPDHDRPPIAQTFEVLDKAVGKRFTVIANHFKSKGCSAAAGTDADASDGQGCYTDRRTKQAKHLLLWLAETVLPATPNVLLLGDFNSYAKETPVTTLTDGGFTDLSSSLLGPAAYSYVFDGQLGLDQAFASSSLVPQVTGIGIWHINADESDLLDYNDDIRDIGESAFEVKPDGSALSRTFFQEDEPFRASDHDPVLVGLFPIADLVTGVDTPEPVIAGTNLTYTITVTNNGPDAAPAATWTDPLPAGTTFVSVSSPTDWQCSTPVVGAGGTVSCSTGSLAVGSVAVFSLTVAVAPSVPAGTLLTNTATASSIASEGQSGDESGVHTINVSTLADLSVIQVDAPDMVIAGTNLTYMITVNNAGPSNAAAVSISNTLSAGTTFVSASPSLACTTSAVGTISCSIVSLPLGSAVFMLVVNVGSGTTDAVSNTAIVSSGTPDPLPGNESRSATTTVTTSADLQVAVVDSPDPVKAGTDLTYTITVKNAGPSNAADPSLSDTLPAGTTFVSLVSPSGWSCSDPVDGTVSCSNTLLGVSSAVFTLTVAVDPGTTAGTMLSNTATASSSTPDPNPGNQSGPATTTVTTSADVSVTQVDTPDPVTAGMNLTYTIRVNNAGPSNAGVTLSDTLPAGTTFGAFSWPSGWTCTNPAVGAVGEVSCTNPSFGVGDAVFTLVVKVASSVPEGRVLNLASLTSSTPDAAPGDTTATVTTTVISPALVSGTKIVSGPLYPGSFVVYTVVLTNAGPASQQDNPGNEFTDFLETGLTLFSATATAGTATATVGTNTVTWSGSIATGASVTITIKAKVKTGVVPGAIISNQGTLSYDADGNGTNEVSAATDRASFMVVMRPASLLEIPTLDTVGLAVLALSLAMGGAWALRRKRSA
ncbi:MAG TPA: ExeM/NucH family extracellular endonuclease [Thermoanaerobaculia bacterium]|nr:ExeM/NucH family extracellular endonuclease [Thermoanaerobaculia bacterium]